MSQSATANEGPRVTERVAEAPTRPRRGISMRILRPILMLGGILWLFINPRRTVVPADAEHIR